MDSTRTAERGFTLLELMLCVGILALASAAALGACAAVARNAAPGAARDIALMVGENALARARAAVAYAPAAAAGGPATAAGRPWALVPGSTTFTAGAKLRPGACGAGAAALQLPVATSYDAPDERFTVVVTYPRDPCRVAPDGSIAPGNAATITLAESLPPSAYAPGQTVYRDIAPPARM